MNYYEGNIKDVVKAIVNVHAPVALEALVDHSASADGAVDMGLALMEAVELFDRYTDITAFINVICYAGLAETKRANTIGGDYAKGSAKLARLTINALNTFRVA